MIVVHDGEPIQRGDRRSAVAIGVFDGLHCGHQKVVGEIESLGRAHDALATVVTFDPHPALILAPDQAPGLLATMDQRLEGLAALGVDQVRVLTFNEDLARESARSFIERVLVGELDACDIVVGEDFRFGHDRQGDVAMLSHEGLLHGFSVHPARIHGSDYRWSSTAVRRALVDGDLASANDILGRPFTLRGRVGHGDSRGGELGYPTANVVPSIHQLLPQLGIYAGAARTPDQRWWPAAVSVGTRPQFYEDGAVLVEAHLVGFSDDLYETTMDVAFLARLRGEMKFASVSELVAQIDRDVEQSLEIYKKFSPQSSTLLR